MLLRLKQSSQYFDPKAYSLPARLTWVIKVVQSTGNADAILVRKLSVKIMQVEQQDPTAVNDLAFLQLLDQNFAEGFLFRCKMDIKGKEVSQSDAVVLISSADCILPSNPSSQSCTFPESAPPIIVQMKGWLSVSKTRFFVRNKVAVTFFPTIPSTLFPKSTVSHYTTMNRRKKESTFTSKANDKDSGCWQLEAE